MPGGNLIAASNPFGLLVAGDAIYFPDAGYNSVTAVNRLSGRIQTITHFPPVPNSSRGEISPASHCRRVAWTAVRRCHNLAPCGAKPFLPSNSSGPRHRDGRDGHRSPWTVAYEIVRSTSLGR